MKLLFSLHVLGLAVATNVPLTMLSDPKAKCLDGSQAGYYAQTASNPDDKLKWVNSNTGLYSPSLTVDVGDISERGGECDSESACQYQTGSALGSSKYLANESDPLYWYLASDYCPYNPSFCGWNHVQDPYCTQDLHSGQVTEATDETWGLYFSGHLVLEAILDELDQSPYNLVDATDIVLHGVSAGGIGVWMNVDYIANRYPNARVTAATIAGHYFYATYYTGENHTDPGGMADFREEAWPSTYDLYQAYVDESCKEAYEEHGLSPGHCMLSNNSYPYIQSDAFVIQSQTDSVVLTGHDCWPEDYMYEQPEQEFMEEWHSNMTIALEPLMKLGKTDGPRNGVFAAACYTHGDFTHAHPLINGLNFYQAFSNFYFESTSEEEYKLSDDCGLMCNPTCNA